MKTYKLARAEKLIDEIKDIASYNTYPGMEDNERRLQLVLEYILDYEREE